MLIRCYKQVETLQGKRKERKNQETWRVYCDYTKNQTQIKHAVINLAY